MSKSSIALKRFLGNLPFINRVKVVKDLVLKRFDDIERKTDDLLENDTPLLEGTADLVKSVSNLVLEIRFIHQKVEAIYQEVETVHQAYQLMQPRVIRSFDSTPETGLMTYLYSYLPNRQIVDVGANLGDLSERLLEVGYEVYAYEPLPMAFKKLENRLEVYRLFHPYSLALGSMDEVRDFYIPQSQARKEAERVFKPFGSLIKSRAQENIVTPDPIKVSVRSLESLHNSGELPHTIDLVKVGTKGYELEVLRGMGSCRYSVVVAEFWDAQLCFGLSQPLNRLVDMVAEMKNKDYCWYLVIYRVWGEEGVSFYCNQPKSLEKSWGNVFFFENYSVFLTAMNWCASILPKTQFI
jgi:FkbM family methyltransferase